MPRPFWVRLFSQCGFLNVDKLQLPVLDHDIRKVPPLKESNKRRNSQGPQSPTESSTRHTSVSAGSTSFGPSDGGFSISRGESSATSAPDIAVAARSKPLKKKRRHSQRSRLLEKNVRQSSQTKGRRYWNEFGDGSEGSDNEAYVIFVNPDASHDIPGFDTVKKVATGFSSMLHGMGRYLNLWYARCDNTRINEQARLLSGEHSPSVDDSDASVTDVAIKQSKSKRQYFTFPTIALTPAARAREALLFRSCLTSFAASMILLLIATILETTGRRKAAARVDAGVVIGVAASLVFAVIGVGSMLGRRDKLGWAHRGIVSLVFILVLITGVGLLAALA